MSDFSDVDRAPKRKSQWSKRLSVLVLTAALSLGVPSLAQAAPDATPTPTAPAPDETTYPIPTETTAPTEDVSPTVEPTESAAPAPAPTAPNATPELTVPVETPDPKSVDQTNRAVTSAARVSGADRFATAVQLSKSSYPGTAPVVVIATGENFPDALSAGPAAVKLGGPLLLTYRDDVPASVIAEIKRLKPTKIVIVGGTVAVSTRAEQQLSALVSHVDRYSGSNRYATSAIVAQCAWSSRFSLTKDMMNSYYGGFGLCDRIFFKADTAYLAVGTNFPDALAAGAAAGRIKAPVLVAPTSNRGVGGWGTGFETALFGAKRISDVRIVGGPNALSNEWETIATKWGANPVRLSGATRFDTAVAVNNYAFRSAPGAYLATGSNFPDALAGAAAAGKRGAPLYLSQGNCVPSSVLNDMARLGLANTSKVTLIGGPNALNANVARLGRC